MVNALAGCLIALATLGQGPAPDVGPDEGFRKALGKESFPWYDAPKDAVKPVNIRVDWEPGNVNLPDFGIGRLIVWTIFGIGLAGLIWLLVWLWRLYEPLESGQVPARAGRPGEPDRVESLPEGMCREFESKDPWEEALRRRGRGDLAGAVVCLFAHQLLTLMKLGLVRLAPGRTGRQLLRAVTDAEFRSLVMPTLRLFEIVYYGHRIPSDEEFAAVWANAEAFERRVARGVAA